MKKIDIPKKGFYYNKYPWGDRCMYCTGTTTGNKWLRVSNSKKWVGLMWWAMEDIKNAVYSIKNPTNISL